MLEAHAAESQGNGLGRRLVVAGIYTSAENRVIEALQRRGSALSMRISDPATQPDGSMPPLGSRRPSSAKAQDESLCLSIMNGGYLLTCQGAALTRAGDICCRGESPLVL